MAKESDGICWGELALIATHRCILVTESSDKSTERNYSIVRVELPLTSDLEPPPDIRRTNLEIQYVGWSQTGGYFDGDGSSYVVVHDWVLGFSLQWVDNWKPQLVQLSDFLQAQGVASKLYPREGAWLLSVIRVSDVLEAAKKMISHCSKKRRELINIVEYLENRITASQAIAVFNEEVVSGKRLGVLRKVNLPYTRKEGIIRGRLHKAELLSAFTEDQKQEIRKRHLDSKVPTKDLAVMYGVTVQTIRRVIRCP